jgi:nucleotide-binding universal stress UspA family protein
VTGPESGTERRTALKFGGVVAGIMYDDILLPTDGSSGTVDALDHAITVASDQDARIHVLYVLDKRLYTAASDESKAEIRQSLEEEAGVALDDARVRIEDEGIECVTVNQEGIPYTAITDYADAEDIDLVVMGTRSRTERDRMVNLGSTTERVLKNASQPVLVVDIE